MSDEFDPEAVPVRPAATVIPLRDGTDGIEVLVVRRDSQLVFHANSWVFPGGRVDDEELAAAGGDELVAARAAAVREAHEEAGLTIDADDLVELSHWTTPVGPKRRFATWFFVVAAPEGSVVVDDAEIREFEWHRIDDVLALSEAGEVQLAGPTYVSLLRLRPHLTVADALAWAHGRPNERFSGRPYRSEAGLFSVYEDDPAWESGDLDAPGPRHRNHIRADGSYEYICDRDPPAR